MNRAGTGGHPGWSHWSRWAAQSCQSRVGWLRWTSREVIREQRFCDEIGAGFTRRGLVRVNARLTGTTTENTDEERPAAPVGAYLELLAHGRSCQPRQSAAASNS